MLGDIRLWVGDPSTSSCRMSLSREMGKAVAGFQSCLSYCVPARSCLAYYVSTPVMSVLLCSNSVPVYLVVFQLQSCLSYCVLNRSYLSDCVATPVISVLLCSNSGHVNLVVLQLARERWEPSRDYCRRGNIVSLNPTRNAPGAEPPPLHRPLEHTVMPLVFEESDDSLQGLLETVGPLEGNESSL